MKAKLESQQLENGELLRSKESEYTRQHSEIENLKQQMQEISSNAIDVEEMKALKARHDKEKQDLNSKLAEEKKTLLTGKCFSCGKGVDGSPPFGKYDFNNYHASMCAYCKVTRKCPDCKWPLECAYNDMNHGKHGYCSFCKDLANICDRCDGGCYACQRDNGCCAIMGDTVGGGYNK